MVQQEIERYQPTVDQAEAEFNEVEACLKQREFDMAQMRAEIEETEQERLKILD